MRVSFSQLPYQCLLLVAFLISHSDKYEVISHCGLFSFSWRLVMVSTFSGVCWPTVSLFWSMSIQVLCLFSNQIGFLMLSCMSSLYILHINPLSDISFANIFSHLVGHLFVLLIVSITTQMFFSLVQSNFFLFRVSFFFFLAFIPVV